MRINVTDRQLHQYLQCIKTFRGFYLYFYQNFMESFLLFVLRFNLDRSFVIIIFNEYRGIVDERTLYVATSFLPRLLFIVKVERHN